MPRDQGFAAHMPKQEQVVKEPNGHADPSKALFAHFCSTDLNESGPVKEVNAAARKAKPSRIFICRECWEWFTTLDALFAHFRESAHFDVRKDDNIDEAYRKQKSLQFGFMVDRSAGAAETEALPSSAPAKDLSPLVYICHCGARFDHPDDMLNHFRETEHFEARMDGNVNDKYRTKIGKKFGVPREVAATLPPAPVSEVAVPEVSSERKPFIPPPTKLDIEGEVVFQCPKCKKCYEDVLQLNNHFGEMDRKHGIPRSKPTETYQKRMEVMYGVAKSDSLVMGDTPPPFPAPKPATTASPPPAATKGDSAKPVARDTPKELPPGAKIFYKCCECDVHTSNISALMTHFKLTKHFELKKPSSGKAAYREELARMFHTVWQAPQDEDEDDDAE